MSRKNRTPEENARRAKIRELLQDKIRYNKLVLHGKLGDYRKRG